MIAIPLALTCFRLLLGPVLIYLAGAQANRVIYMPLLLAGMLSDVFDGVLARRLGVSRSWLRRFDSAADVIFYLCVLATAFMVASETIIRAALPFSLLVASEVACISVSLIRFGALPATHCYSAKVYGFGLFVTFSAILSFEAGPWAVWILCGLGLTANAEVVAILIRSATPPVDVPTVFRMKRAKEQEVSPSD